MTRLASTNTRTFLHPILSAVICLAALVLATPPCHALDDQQQAQLDQANNLIKNAGYDLDAARGSAGTPDNPAKGSRAKLTEMRLSSARQRLEQADESLSKLPEDDQAVTDTREAYNTVDAGIKEVDAIIHPPAKPKQEEPPAADDDNEHTDAPAGDNNNETKSDSPDQAQKPKADNDEPAAKPTPTEKPKQAPRLDYKQEDLLRNARWFVRETNAYADKAATVVERMDDENAEKPVHKELIAALELIETGKQKHKLAQGYIDQLPADHPTVKPVADDVKQAGDRLGALASRLTAADAKLAKLADINNYPNFDKDFTLLQDLGRRYTQFDITVQQPEKLASIIKEDPQVLAEIKRIAKTYLPLVEQKTPQGERIENMFNNFMTTRSRFADRLTAYKEQLPAQFESDLKEATDLADEGVAKQNAMYFGPDSGIEQRFGWAEKKLLVLQAFGEKEAKPYADRLEQVRNDINQRAKSLEAKIIANNTLPADNYTGDDRQAVIDIAIDGWKVQQPDAQVLTARIPSQAWSRETRWEWYDGSFYKVDKSTLQVQLIVKHDDKLAVIRPLNVRQDHLKGDTMIAVPLDDIKDDLIPQRFLPLDKVK